MSVNVRSDERCCPRRDAGASRTSTEVGYLILMRRCHTVASTLQQPAQTRRAKTSTSRPCAGNRPAGSGDGCRTTAPAHLNTLHARASASAWWESICYFMAIRSLSSSSSLLHHWRAMLPQNGGVSFKGPGGPHCANRSGRGSDESHRIPEGS